MKPRVTSMLVVRLAAMAGLAFIVPACEDDVAGGGAAPDPDTMLPQVTGTSPADGATDVSIALAAVTVTFDEPMDPATINEGSVVLLGAAGVAGTVTYDAPSMTATFVPAGGLSFLAEYTVVVTPGA